MPRRLCAALSAAVLIAVPRTESRRSVEQRAEEAAADAYLLGRLVGVDSDAIGVGRFEVLADFDDDPKQAAWTATRVGPAPEPTTSP